MKSNISKRFGFSLFLKSFFIIPDIENKLSAGTEVAVIQNNLWTILVKIGNLIYLIEKNVTDYVKENVDYLSHL